jgi:hypothetical protein
MTGVLFTIGLVVWLIGVLAFVRIARGWYTAYRSAPAGQGFAAACDLGSLNLASLERRIGPVAKTIFGRFRNSVVTFALCVAAIVALAIVNIASGNAA